MEISDIDIDGILFARHVESSYSDDESEGFIKKLFAKKKPQKSFYESRMNQIGSDELYEELKGEIHAYWVKDAPSDTVVILTSNYLVLPGQDIISLNKISKYGIYNIPQAPFAQYALDRMDVPYDPYYVSEYEGEETFELDRFKICLVIIDIYGIRYKYDFLMECSDRRDFRNLLDSRCEGVDFTKDDVLNGTFDDDDMMTGWI